MKEKEELKIKRNNKTILKDRDIKLEKNITIFAGENNSGKTQIVRAIQDSIGEDKVIFIPADHVILENEIKTNTAKEPFLKNLEKLVSLELDDNNFKIENEINDIDKELPKVFKEYGVNDIDLEIKRGKVTKEEYAKECKNLYIKKIIDSISINDTLSNKEQIKLTDAGQGTERLVIVSLIRYLAEKIDKENEIECLIIEEPEIFLHPKLKKDFNISLLKLSKKIKVILTTHDPYFITLNDTQGIYKVSRSLEDIKETKETKNLKKGETKIELVEDKGELDYISHAEINYKIFELATVEYALQLYEEYMGKVKKEDIDKDVKIKEFQDSKFVNIEKKEIKLVDYRNDMAHQDYSANEEDLKRFIEKILKIKKTS